MPVNKIRLRPGVDTNQTPTANEAGFSDASLMRARDGLMETIGGWKNYYGQGTGIVLPCARVQALHVFSILAFPTTYLIAAAGDRPIIFGGVSGTAFDIGPVAATHTLANAVTTSNGSSVVSILDSVAAFVVGTPISVNITSSVGGLATGLFLATVLTTGGGAGAWTCTAQLQFSRNGVSVVATGSATGGGTVTVSINTTYLAGYGPGPDWSLDNWGQQLMLCPRGGLPLTWFPTGIPASAVRAVPLGGNQPLVAAGLLVAMPERHLVLFGSAPYGSSTQDPMLVTWSDTEDYTQWQATATNAAGSFRIAAGNKIIAWKRTTSQILIFTDIGLVGMAYIGTPYIYGFNELATGCGIVTSKAMAAIGSTAFWMGNLAFWTYNGTAAPLDCSVRDKVFGNVNLAYVNNIFCAANAQFNEVTWFYPSIFATENDSYVTYNYVDGTWVCGAMARTAWLDSSLVLNGHPIATSPDPILYTHEDGFSADGGAIANSLTTGYFDIGDGQDFTVLDQVIPDYGHWSAPSSGSVAITVKSQQWPGGPVTTKGPFNTNSATKFISPRLRGRQVQLKFDTVGTQTPWRLGALRVRTASDGRR